MTEPFGFLVVDKPSGMTSHDVVAVVRRGTRVKRIGHTGTLDPMATGVLILCIGAATRLTEYVMHQQKVYTAAVRLGIETDSYDADGQVTFSRDASHITQADLDSAILHFQGEVEQIPPMYSALQIDGKRLYELARAGQTVERAPRRVMLETHLLSYTPPDLILRVTCSAGTYIRSIAHDLGEQLGVGAHLTALRRESSGNLSDPVAWADLQTAMQQGTWQHWLIDERVALANLPALNLTAEQSSDVVHGRAIIRPVVRAQEDSQPLVRAYDSDGRFLAILEAKQESWQPVKVFVSH